MEYTSLIQTSNKTDVDKMLDQLDALYSIGTPAVTDEVYDYLVDIYTERFGPRQTVGAPATEEDIPLPVAMMSLDKVLKHEPNKLQNWKNKNPGPYIVMDKINGNPGLYTITHTVGGPITKLYKRGDGSKGPDISHILPFLNLPILPFDVYIKGEMVIDKEDFEPHKGEGTDQYKTNLSMVTGLTNWKNSNPNPEHLKMIKFIAFDISFPKQDDMNMSQTLEHLAKYKFQAPYYITTSKLSIESLGEIYQKQKKEQTYDVDGIVIMDDRPIKYTEKLLRENPKYGIAYKEQGDVYETTVTHVVWEASKHGILTPVVHVEEISVGDTGFTIRHPTGHNARFMVKHRIGVGATIKVVHNTVPKIIGSVIGVEPAMPPPDKYPVDSWEWNETGAEIVLKDKETDEVRIARLYEFFKKDKINAKGWGEKKVEKLYYAGFDTLKKLLETDKIGFMDGDIEGIGEKTIDNLIQSRDLALSQTSLATIMAGSGAFEHGMGTRMIQKVIDIYPDILDREFSLEEIVVLEGFKDKQAQKFLDGLPKFKVFLKEIPILQQVAKGELKRDVHDVLEQKLVTVEPVTGESLNGINMVFTGFRDKILEAYVKSQGGDVKTGVTKKVNYLIIGGPKGEGSSKEKKAIGYNIPVLSIAEFKGKFGIP